VGEVDPLGKQHVPCLRPHYAPCRRPQPVSGFTPALCSAIQAAPGLEEPRPGRATPALVLPQVLHQTAVGVEPS
jgi:hypothetical protein